MKTLIASTVIALAFAAPAVAGNTALVEFAQTIANESTDGPNFRVGVDTTPSSPALVAFAQEIANASTDGPDFRVDGASDVTASTRGMAAGNAQLAASLGVSADTPLVELAGIIAERASDD